MKQRQRNVRRFVVRMAVALFTMNACCAVAFSAQEFEVASIKLNQNGSRTDLTTSPGGRFNATNVTLQMLVQYGFGVKDSEIMGGPDWISVERYDIVAKADSPKQLSENELEPLVRALLADRFKLTVHREIKELPVYSLVLGRKGPKLAEHLGPVVSSVNTSYESGVLSMNAVGISMASLADHLGRQQLARTVTDDTGLRGAYDFKLEWAPQQTADSAGPSIFTALQDQLGLKLEEHKGPVEVVVIDRAEKASGN